MTDQLASVQEVSSAIATLDSSVLFASPTDRIFPAAWNPERVSMTFRRAARRAGLAGFRFHDLRHDFASQLALHGAQLQAVQLYLGHTTLRMTERYSHLTPSAHAETIKLLEEPDNGSE